MTKFLRWLFFIQQAIMQNIIFSHGIGIVINCVLIYAILYHGGKVNEFYRAIYPTVIKEVIRAVGVIDIHIPQDAHHIWVKIMIHVNNFVTILCIVFRCKPPNHTQF